MRKTFFEFMDNNAGAGSASPSMGAGSAGAMSSGNGGANPAGDNLGFGEKQRDPDSPNKAQELMDALKEIMKLANQALGNSDSEGDEGAGGEKGPGSEAGGSDSPPAQSSADSPSSLFGNP